MKNKPTKILLLTKMGDEYGAKFPYLSIPIIVNEYHLKKILENSDYQFIIFNKDFLNDAINYSFSSN